MNPLPPDPAWENSLTSVAGILLHFYFILQDPALDGGKLNFPAAFC